MLLVGSDRSNHKDYDEKSLDVLKADSLWGSFALLGRSGYNC